MTKRKVIMWRNQATNYPVFSTIVLWLLIDRYHVSGAVFGVICTIWSIVWILSIFGVLTQVPVDIFEDKCADKK